MGKPRSMRTTRSSRWCYRYRYAIYLALFFVVFQIVVALSFLSLDSDEQKKQRELNSLPREERQADSGAHVPLLNSQRHKFRLRPDLMNGDYFNEGGLPAGHSAINKEENVLLLHPQELTRLPSNDRNAPDAKEAYRTNNHKSDLKSGSKDQNYAEDGQRIAIKRLNLVNRDTDSKHALIVHSIVNDSHIQKANAAASDPAGKYPERPPVPIQQNVNIGQQDKLSLRDREREMYRARVTYFPKCSITRADVEAYSAISRASTAECKQDIADTVCKMKDNAIYPMKLPSFCPVEGKLTTDIENLDEVNLSTHPPARIAYILVTNGRAFRQVRRLIKLLYHTDHFIYIHVDKRSDYLHRELSKVADRYPNIMMTPWRYATIWGGASLLSVYLQAMKDLVAMENLNWDFLINLSESDFPIKTNAQLVKFLGYYRRHNFLKSHGRDKSSYFIRKQGLDRIFQECDNHMWRIGDRKLPTGIVYDGGSDWFGLSNEYCEYLVTSNNTMITGLKELFKYSLLPAESFFHIVLENSELCDTIIDNNLHITNWKRKLGCQCQYKHIVDWCGCSPNVFKPEDFFKIRNTRPVYFSRKFEPIVSQSVINQVDTLLYGAFPLGTPGINMYSQNVYHNEDTITVTSDAEMTAYRSFMRIMKEIINWKQKNTLNTCQFNFSTTPQRVSITQRMDLSQGIVLTSRATTSSDPTQILNSSEHMLEMWFSPITHYRLVELDGPGARLKSFKVGTNFDSKEWMFRNYGGLMGPYDNPTIGSLWSKGDEYALTITWIDPAQHIAASFDTSIEEEREELHHQPPFNKPLRPGKWTVKLVYQWSVVAETNFLIIPLSVVDGKAISPSKAFEANSGPPKNDYVGKDFSPLRDVFGLVDNVQLLVNATRNAKKSGLELEHLVDDTMKSFWTMSGFCMHGGENSCVHITACEEYPWSTFSPDPKTELGNVNAFGRLR